MKFEYIFLDMDGVLCDFMASAFRVHSREFNRDDYPIGVWEIADHWQMPVDDFWAAIHADADFWTTIPVYPWVEELIALSRAHAKQVKILTSPAKHANCFAGKRQWWEKFIPRDIELIICKSKHLLAGPTRLLIDDGDHNVVPWTTAGGPAILFPQPWNQNWHLADLPMSHVRHSLAMSTVERAAS